MISLRLSSLSRLTVISVAALTLSVSAANALGPHGDAFAGYSNVDGASGFETALHFKVAPFIGVEGNFSGYGYGVTTTNQRVYLFLVGPRVSVGTKHVTGYVHGLIGGGRGAYQESDDAEFVYAAGGGLDFKVVSRLSWRVAGDFIDVPQAPATGPHTGRVSTGPVFHF